MSDQIVDMLLTIQRADAQWRQQAEQMEQQRNAAYAELAAAVARAAALEAELADMRPKYEALLVEVDAHDQASSWANTSATVTTSLREAALEAERDQYRAALEEVEQESLIQGRRIGIWMCPRCGVESTMRLAIHHAEDCQFAVLAGQPAADGGGGEG